MYLKMHHIDFFFMESVWFKIYDNFAGGLRIIFIAFFSTREVLRRAMHFENFLSFFYQNS